ncbi:MAG: hypothetical protein V3V04_05850 [Rhizobiaceae bacterium]
MLTRLPRFTRLAAFSALLLSSTSVAHALEGKALFDQIMGKNLKGATVTSKNFISDSADSFTMIDVVVSAPNKEPIKIKTLVVRGLKEIGEDRIEVDAFTILGFSLNSRREGNITVEGISLSGASFPTFLFGGDYSAQQKKARVKIKGFAINDFEVVKGKVNVKMGTFAFNNADIPLDFRYDGEESTEPPAAPLTIQALGTTKLYNSQDGLTMSLASFSAANISIPTSLAVAPTEWMKLYSALSIDDAKSSIGDKQVFSMTRLSGTLSKANSEGTYTSTSTMEGLEVNLKAIPDQNAQQIAAQLGYDKIQGSMVGNGTYNPDSGRLTIDDLSMNLKDMFDMTMKYAINGYTKDVAQQFTKVQAEIAAGKNPAQAYGAIMPSLSKVKLEAFSLNLVDHSLTGKLLDYQAGQMGTTGEQLALGAPMMIGMGMGQLNMPVFTEMVSTALGNFLKNKGSISLVARPSEPISIMQLVISGQADPTTLPDMLKLEVIGK